MNNVYSSLQYLKSLVTGSLTPPAAETKQSAEAEQDHPLAPGMRPNTAPNATSVATSNSTDSEYNTDTESEEADDDVSASGTPTDVVSPEPAVEEGQKDSPSVQPVESDLVDVKSLNGEERLLLEDAHYQEKIGLTEARVESGKDSDDLLLQTQNLSDFIAAAREPSDFQTLKHIYHVKCNSTVKKVAFVALMVFLSIFTFFLFPAIVLIQHLYKVGVAPAALKLRVRIISELYRHTINELQENKATGLQLKDREDVLIGKARVRIFTNAIQEPLEATKNMPSSELRSIGRALTRIANRQEQLHSDLEKYKNSLAALQQAVVTSVELTAAQEQHLQDLLVLTVDRHFAPALADDANEYLSGVTAGPAFYDYRQSRIDLRNACLSKAELDEEKTQELQKALRVTDDKTKPGRYYFVPVYMPARSTDSASVHSDNEHSSVHMTEGLTHSASVHSDNEDVLGTESLNDTRSATGSVNSRSSHSSDKKRMTAAASTKAVMESKAAQKRQRDALKALQAKEKEEKPFRDALKKANAERLENIQMVLKALDEGVHESHMALRQIQSAGGIDIVQAVQTVGDTQTDFSRKIYFVGPGIKPLQELKLHYSSLKAFKGEITSLQGEIAKLEKEKAEEIVIIKASFNKTNENIQEIKTGALASGQDKQNEAMMLDAIFDRDPSASGLEKADTGIQQEKSRFRIAMFRHGARVEELKKGIARLEKKKSDLCARYDSLRDTIVKEGTDLLKNVYEAKGKTAPLIDESKTIDDIFGELINDQYIEEIVGNYNALVQMHNEGSKKKRNDFSWPPQPKPSDAGVGVGNSSSY